VVTTTQYQIFTKYYEQYFDQLYRYVLFRSGQNKDVAFDLTSELFLKALEKFDSFDPDRSDFKNWLYGIARNHLIDYYRTNRPTVDIADVDHLLVAPDKLVETLNVSYDTANVLYALSKIPESQREIIQLKFFGELTNQELAQMFNKTEGNIRVMLHRAITTLKQEIARTFSPIHAQTVTRTHFQGIIAH
jgi:RNA polymerase sigma factor (sigma-70 family)